MTSERSRVRLAVTAVVVVALGLATTALGGVVGDLVGGALYAVLVTVLLAIALPRLRALVLGGVALAVCVVVELLQLAGVAVALADAVPTLGSVVRLVLGSTFWAPDLAAYAVGAAAGSGAVRLVSARAATPRPAEPGPTRSPTTRPPA
ncbi:DUF2809 domain-containing protein [Actinotalea sp. AC32]|nr:DUF2809 domain-containing protein [Actinotalea sp. AC32]